MTAPTEHRIVIMQASDLGPPGFQRLYLARCLDCPAYSSRLNDSVFQAEQCGKLHVRGKMRRNDG